MNVEVNFYFSWEHLINTLGVVVALGTLFGNHLLRQMEGRQIFSKYSILGPCPNLFVKIDIGPLLLFVSEKHLKKMYSYKWSVVFICCVSLRTYFL